MSIQRKLQTQENMQYFKSCLEDLKLVLSGSTKADSSFVEKKIDETMETNSSLFKEYLKGDMTPTNVLKVVDDLHSKLDSDYVVELSVAFEPSEKFMDKLYKWFSDNVSENAVMKLNVEPNLIGGVVINAGGNYTDLSVRNKLEGFFKEKGLKINA